MTTPIYPSLNDDTVVHNPILPTCLPIPNGRLESGTQITIMGKFHEEVNYMHDYRNFRLDLFLGDCEHIRGQQSDIAFHFNPRFGEDSVVMNSFQSGRWDNEIIEEEFPFESGKTFCLILKVKNDGFEIIVDGEVFAFFPHRYNFNIISRLHIEGRLKIDIIKFEKYEEIESSSTSEDSEESDEDVDERPIYFNDPEIPFFYLNPELFSRPCRVNISGMIEQPFDEYFAINFADSQGNEEQEEFTDIPIHLSIRANQRKIIRNALINDEWGPEETFLNEPFGLYPGTIFNITVATYEEKAVIHINGRHAFDFLYRTALDEIDSIEINGSVVINTIRIQPI
ncbi:galectin-like protein 5 [Sarcoptes scabiei]|uniref:Galectin-like protein 5 n=1 Tax=Sarcoptes scabiei TaxID=52283 RepID=A0A132AF25_SARSC|nr:galectin-like protein 5 [Sarcoptes scabiei]